MKALSKTVILILLTFIGSNAQFDSLRIKPTIDFTITGKGENENWNKAEWVDIPQRNVHQDRYETKAKVLYSETGIYFLFHCSDNYITSTLKEDFANLWEEDVVEVFLWTDEAYPFYFEYELSPNNYELPIIVPNVEGKFLGWRPWKYEGNRRVKHATSINKKGEATASWTAEFFIPFELLKPMNNIPPEPGTIWRGNLYRLDYDEEVTSWQWQPIVKNFHDYTLFGYFVFE